MSNGKYTFNKRDEALECLKRDLATVTALELHIIKRDPDEKSDAREIRMVLETNGQVVAVKFPLRILKSFEEEVKRFYDRYAKFF